MTLAMVVTVITVVVAQGQTWSPAPHSLRCYKKTTDFEGIFMCQWVDQAPAEEVLYKFCYSYKAMSKCIYRGLEKSFVLVRDAVPIMGNISMWVEAVVGNRSFSSANTSVILHTQVKYDAPQSITVSRAAGNVTLRWPKQAEENKGAIHEMMYRRRGEQIWQITAFQTDDKSKTEEYTVPLLDNVGYEIKIRRRAKQEQPIIWSEWSQITGVPTGIHKSPNIMWKVDSPHNGVRLLRLKWKKPPEEASLGEVMYNLNISNGSCGKNMSVTLNTTAYSINVRLSAVKVSLCAINNLGKSPSARVTVPAYHLQRCAGSQFPPKEKYKKICVEWYKLPDGENRISAIFSQSTEFYNFSQALNEITKGMEDSMRYYYFIHAVQKRRSHTLVSCPIYKKEGVPTGAPQNVSVTAVKDWALLVWEHIPVQEQRGFLTNYIIYISNESQNKIEIMCGITQHFISLIIKANVSWLDTNYTLRNLKSGSMYTVHLAGETKVGLGPNATVQFQMLANKGLSMVSKAVIGLCVFTLLFTIFCSFIVKRFKSKFLPAIPSPVITETPVCHHRKDKIQQSSCSDTEEVHPVLLLPYKEERSSKADLEERDGLLEGGSMLNREEEEEEEEDPSRDGPDALHFIQSDDYKKQSESIPASEEPTEFSPGQVNSEQATPTYRNGLVLEMKTQDSCEEGKELALAGPAISLCPEGPKDDRLF